MAKVNSAKLENMLMEKQIELESLIKEIEMHRIENDRLEKRVAEVLHTKIVW